MSVLATGQQPWLFFAPTVGKLKKECYDGEVRTFITRDDNYKRITMCLFEEQISSVGRVFS